ncbi:hypothetical protein AB5N19_06798 [Seiridium cardinale]
MELTTAVSSTSSALLDVWPVLMVALCGGGFLGYLLCAYQEVLLGAISRSWEALTTWLNRIHSRFGPSLYVAYLATICLGCLVALFQRDPNTCVLDAILGAYCHPAMFILMFIFFPAVILHMRLGMDDDIYRRAVLDRSGMYDEEQRGTVAPHSFSYQSSSGQSGSLVG